MTTIVGISGSLREQSFNTMLLRAAAAAMPADSRLEIATIRGIPLYDGDVEARDGIPPAVQALKDTIAAADGLLLVTPEYNNSMPGTLKNAIDWLTRPPRDIARVFRGRPVALMGATPGGGGTILAQNAWLPVFRTLGMLHWTERRLIVSNAASVFDEAGALVDEATRAKLAKFIEGFVTFVLAKR
jgi:NAD(P)H-dependent FMN reductase